MILRVNKELYAMADIGRKSWGEEKTDTSFILIHKNALKFDKKTKYIYVVHR